MDHEEMQAKLLTHQAALQAMLLTRAEPSKAGAKFLEIATESVRSLNKGGKAEVASALQREAAWFAHYFKAYGGS